MWECDKCGERNSNKVKKCVKCSFPKGKEQYIQNKGLSLQAALVLSIIMTVSVLAIWFYKERDGEFQHEWGPVVYIWSDDNSAVVATRHCTNNPDHIQTETVKTTCEITEQPTCGSKGTSTYTSASFKNSAFKIQVKAIQNIDKLEHVWGTVTYNWSNDHSSVTAKRVCQNDSSHIESETVSSSKKVTTPATCVSKGKSTYSASFSNKAYTTQTITVSDIAAYGHDWQPATYDKPKTCTRCGIQEGTVKGYIGWLEGDFSDSDVYLRGSQSSGAFELRERINNCFRLTVSFEITDYSGWPFGSWYLYARDFNGHWSHIAEFEVTKDFVHSEQEIHLDFSPDVSFDALSLVKKGNDGFSIGYSVGFKDAQVR